MTGEEAVVAVIEALNGVGIPYMLVGSFSANFYGVPRSTQDADFVIVGQGLSIKALVAKLGPGFKLNPQMSFELITGTYKYHLELADGSFQIELFLLSEDEHDQERFRRRRKEAYPHRETYLPTPEDVIITKLRWSLGGKRNKDSDDVRNIIAVRGPRLDWDYVHTWCDKHGTRGLLEEIRQSIPDR